MGICGERDVFLWNWRRYLSLLGNVDILSMNNLEIGRIGRRSVELEVIGRR